MFHVKPVFWACLGMLLAVSGVALAAGDEVHFAGPGVELTAYLYRPEGKGPFPALVMMHGCSGLYGKSGKPTRSYRFWAEHFRDRGFVTLLVDSFGPRGEREICTQKDRRISEATDRPRDAHAALDWLAGQPDVDPRRINLMGWSNGGTTVLNTVKPDTPGRGPDGPRFHAAVAFYPGCSAFARTALKPTAPLLIQAGGADDWTPARHCEALARRSLGEGSPIAIDVYPGAHHGFDSIDVGVRVRPDVRNSGTKSGWGATVGTNPEARAKAIARTTDWLEQANRP
jgi:dienelactone hydrolase